MPQLPNVFIDFLDDFISVRRCPSNGIFGPCACLLAGGSGAWRLLARLHYCGYVALTQVQRREDLLIYRPFERELFTKGGRRGPMPLLSLLRGEPADWSAIEKEFTLHASCRGCGFVKFKPAFMQHQWTRPKEQRYCKVCVARKIEAGTPLQCNTCHLWRHEATFASKYHDRRYINMRVHGLCSEEVLQGVWSRKGGGSFSKV